MSEYIDRNELLKNINKNVAEAHNERCSQLLEAILNAPTADVVEVVRCRDCIYYEANCCFNPQWDMESSPEVPMVRETDFCSYGERSENGT